jgi:parallel beta-helix repeat protein
MRRRSLAVAAITLALVAVLLIFVLAALQVIPLLPKAEPRTITVPDDYASIQEAINNAGAGDTVFVRAGTYNVRGYHPISIDKPISLIGENRENTIINALPYFMQESLIFVEAESVTISGLSINGSRIGIGLWNTASKCKIIGNNIANAYDGISTNRASGCVIDQNGISTCNTGISETSSNGVISNNDIQRNKRGIVIDEAENVIVKQNTIANNSEGLRLRWYGPFYVYGTASLTTLSMEYNLMRTAATL